MEKGEGMGMNSVSAAFATHSLGNNTSALREERNASEEKVFFDIKGSQ